MGQQQQHSNGRDSGDEIRVTPGGGQLRITPEEQARRAEKQAKHASGNGKASNNGAPAEDHEASIPLRFVDDEPQEQRIGRDARAITLEDSQTPALAEPDPAPAPSGDLDLSGSSFAAASIDQEYSARDLNRLKGGRVVGHTFVVESLRTYFLDLLNEKAEDMFGELTKESIQGAIKAELGELSPVFLLKTFDDTPKGLLKTWLQDPATLKILDQLAHHTIFADSGSKYGRQVIEAGVIALSECCAKAKEEGRLLVLPRIFDQIAEANEDRVNARQRFATIQGIIKDVLGKLETAGILVNLPENGAAVLRESESATPEFKAAFAALQKGLLAPPKKQGIDWSLLTSLHEESAISDAISEGDTATTAAPPEAAPAAITRPPAAPSSNGAAKVGWRGLATKIGLGRLVGGSKK